MSRENGLSSPQNQDDEQLIRVLNPALKQLRDELTLAALVYGHTFFNHRPNLTECFLYQSVLGRVLREGLVTALMPFPRVFNSHIVGLPRMSVSEGQVEAYLNEKSDLELVPGTLSICEISPGLGIELLRALPDRRLPAQDPLLIIVDPTEPDVPMFDEFMWHLLRDGRSLDLTIWLHTSPLFVPPPILDQFANVIILNPSSAEAESLKRVWGDVPRVKPVESARETLCAWVFGACAAGRRWKDLAFHQEPTGGTTMYGDQYLRDRKQSLEAERASTIADMEAIYKRYRATTSVIDRNKLDLELETMREHLDTLQRDYEGVCQMLGEKPATLPDPLAEQLQRIEDGVTAVQAQSIKTAEDLQETRQKILAHVDQSHADTVSTLLAALDSQTTEIVAQIQEAIAGGVYSGEELQELVGQLQLAVEKVQELSELPEAVDARIQQSIKRLEPILSSEMEVHNKLKLTIPIVPMLVEYEAELEIADLNLKSLWDRLIERVRRH